MWESFKKIILQLRPLKRNVTIILIASVIWSLSRSGYSIMIKQIVDSAEKGHTQDFWKNSGIVLGLAFIVMISRYYSAYFMGITSEIVAQRIRQQLQKKFMSLNLTYHNNFTSGSGGLLSRTLNDLLIFRDGIRLATDFIREPLLVVALIAQLFYFNWKVTVLLFITLPITGVIMKSLNRSIRKYGEGSQLQFEKVTSTIKESLDGLRTIQSFSLEKEMEKRFAAESDDFIEFRRKVFSRLELGSPLTELIGTFAFLMVLLFLLSQVSSGEISWGDLTAYVMAALGVGQPLRKIQESYTRYQEAAVASQRIYEILDSDSEVPESKSPIPFPQNWQEITYKNVNFTYGTTPILKDINFSVKRGEMIALVGSSGSGKSTIVNLLERFFDPHSGDILIGDVPIQQIALKDLRHNIALVSQDVFLFSDSIQKNIQAGDFNRNANEVVEVAKMANAHEFISKFPHGYESRVGDRGNLLSGGEKQRISIARAFFKNAPILILDEATSALDSVSEIEVQKGLDHLAEGRTTFVIAHRLSTIKNADRIFVMKNGQIIESGSHEDLIRLGKEYAHLYSLQSGSVAKN